MTSDRPILTTYLLLCMICKINQRLCILQCIQSRLGILFNKRRGTGGTFVLAAVYGLLLRLFVCSAAINLISVYLLNYMYPKIENNLCTIQESCRCLFVLLSCLRFAKPHSHSYHIRPKMTTKSGYLEKTSRAL